MFTVRALPKRPLAEKISQGVCARNSAKCVFETLSCRDKKLLNGAVAVRHFVVKLRRKVGSEMGFFLFLGPGAILFCIYWIYVARWISSLRRRPSVRLLESRLT